MQGRVCLGTMHVIFQGRRISVHSPHPVLMPTLWKATRGWQGWCPGEEGGRGRGLFSEHQRIISHRKWSTQGHTMMTCR